MPKLKPSFLPLVDLTFLPFLNDLYYFFSLQGIARLQRHEQIVDEVKLALKPFFKHGEITKDDYKLIMRKSVEKVCGIVLSNDLLCNHSICLLSLDCACQFLEFGGTPKH